MASGDDWHPIGLSHAIDAGSSAGTRLHGEELVIWRDAGGVVHVWEDRCPHRGMRLSFGFVRGNHIACLYHGWQYDSGGVCQYIPAHPDLAVPSTIKVRGFMAAERGGMIWTTLSENPAPLHDDESQTVPLRSLYLDCNSETAIAAFRAVPMSPFASQEQPNVIVSCITDRLYAVSCGQDRVLIGIQALSDARIALHFTICGPQDLYEGAGQIHFLDWALRLRHTIEQPRRTGFAVRVATQDVL